MSRNLRNRDHPAPNPVSSYPVAPHRYRWDECNDDYRDAPTYREFMNGVPYKIGDVVYIKRNGEARLAYISDVFCERTHYGERREKFRVFVANKKGDTFGKNWIYVYPGDVQRGYKLAGLAPEMPENA